MNHDDCEKQAQDFLDKFKIKFRAELSDSKPVPWKASTTSIEPRHFRVSLSRKRPLYRIYEEIAEQPNPIYRLTFDFWSSIADAEKGIETVEPYDVLSCISGDVHCPETFEDFCAEYGYNNDSIKDQATFKRCSSFARRLKAFFTKEEIEALSEIR